MTFSYTQFSKNSIPVNPRIERIRTDLNWEYLVRDFWENAPLPLGIHSLSLPHKEKIQFLISIQLFLSPVLSIRFLISDQLFFSSLSSLLLLFRLFPPLLSSLSHNNEVPNSKPEPTIAKSLGLRGTKKGEKMRKYFENFAKEKGFDPLVAENWYKINRTAVEELQVNT